MNIILHTLQNSLPLILAATGALISEYAGVTAVFLDGIINLSAFLSFVFIIMLKNVPAAFFLTLLCSVLFMTLIALYTEKSRSNPFINGIAVNLAASGIISIASTSLFKTKGVVSPAILGASEEIQSLFEAGKSFLGTGSIVSVSAVLFITGIMLFFSRWGLRTRITGTNADVLSVRGISPAKYRILSWTIAAAFAGAAGTLCMLRLSAFVPNISSGRGWLALASVFLGRKTFAGTILAAVSFSASEYLANNISSPLISPTVLPALPYIIALLLFYLLGKKKIN